MSGERKGMGVMVAVTLSQPFMPCFAANGAPGLRRSGGASDFHRSRLVVPGS